MTFCTTAVLEDLQIASSYAASVLSAAMTHITQPVAAPEIFIGVGAIVFLTRFKHDNHIDSGIRNFYSVGAVDQGVWGFPYTPVGSGA